MSLRRPLAALVACCLFAPALRADDADARLVQVAAAQFANVRTETLPNGLRVYLLPVPGSPVVTTMVAYRVGSADEEPGQTGLSHYLEHLMFKGTGRLMPGDIDRTTQRNGGRNNAYTSEDLTNYHFDFAADRWPAALEVEADRMRNIRIDAKHEFQQEKGAVIAELKGNEDQPWTLEYKAILPLLFPKGSPYAHPVIGEEEHVRAATAEIIKRYYDKWYHPNNASLVVVGGFDPDDAMARVKKLFGPIPRGELPPRKPVPRQPPRTQPVRKEFASKFDVARMMAGFNGVRAGDLDEYALDIIADVLARGRTSRLYRRLVEEERLANNVSASDSTGRYPGWFSIDVELLQGKDRAKAERIVFDELQKLAKEPVTEAELKRVKRTALASLIFSREGVHSLADAIARAATVTDLDYLKKYLGRLQAVTPADVQRVTAKYLTRPKSVVVWSIPDDNDGKTSSIRAGSVSDGERFNPSLTLPARKEMPVAYASGSDGAGASALSLGNARRVVLPNGVTLILRENHRLPIVVAEAYVSGVRLREPADKSGVAALVGDMLDEGTARHSGKEIATLIEDVGGQLEFSTSGGSLKVLTPDTDRGLALLFECLIHPTFPADALARKRDQQLSLIADMETQPRNRARVLFNQYVYGQHPYGRSAYGTRAIVEKLTREDLKQFHAAAFAPDRAVVVVVGDFDSDAMAKKVEKLTADWTKPAGSPLTVPAPPKPDKPVVKIVTDPSAAQVHVFIGHLGITRKDPDYYTLLVMDNVLGTGPGFTDRLSANLRDRQGLAYTVTAQITGSATNQPGEFLGYIGTFPDKFNIAREGFLAEIAKIRSHPPTAREVEDAKKYLLGSLPFKLTTNASVAGQLLTAERFGLGFDFLEEYRERVAAVTPAAVEAAAKKHLHPNRLVLVAVGPIDADGRPLPAKK